MMLKHLDIIFAVWYFNTMRTTLSLDDDMLAAARSIARARDVSIGKTVSDLMRKGLEHTGSRRVRNGFPVFSAPPEAPPLTLEQIRELDDES